MDKLIAKAAVLIESLPYIQAFRGKTVVVKFGGSTMDDEERISSILKDIVLMEAVGMKMVVIHGGGKAITAKLAELGVPTRFINGLRYTCAETIGVVDAVLHSEINANLIDIIRSHGGSPVQVSGKDVLRAGQITTKDRITGEDIDIGFVGEVTSVDVQKIKSRLSNNDIQVITPLGVDESGQILNINADMAACRLAAELKADKLVFLSDVPGVLRDPKDETSLISTICIDEVDDLIDDGIISGGMVPKIRSAVDALEAGTGKVHMVDGRVRHALLLEIFTDAGVGTQIVHPAVPQ